MPTPKSKPQRKKAEDMVSVPKADLCSLAKFAANNLLFRDETEYFFDSRTPDRAVSLRRLLSKIKRAIVAQERGKK